MEAPMGSMSRLEARDLLDEVAQITLATRARLYASGWQWLVVWSLAFLGAALGGITAGMLVQARQ